MKQTWTALLDETRRRWGGPSGGSKCPDPDRDMADFLTDFLHEVEKPPAEECRSLLHDIDALVDDRTDALRDAADAYLKKHPAPLTGESSALTLDRLVLFAEGVARAARDGAEPAELRGLMSTYLGDLWP